MPQLLAPLYILMNLIAKGRLYKVLTRHIIVGFNPRVFLKGQPIFVRISDFLIDVSTPLKCFCIWNLLGIWVSGPLSLFRKWGYAAFKVGIWWLVRVCQGRWMVSVWVAFLVVCVCFERENGRREKPVVQGSSCNFLWCDKGRKCLRTLRLCSRNQLIC